MIAQTDHLVQQAEVTLRAIKTIADPAVKDAWIDPATLAKAVKVGLLDAPQLRNNRFAPGRVRTRIINGASVAVDENQKQLDEETRIHQILKKGDTL
jgi:hypothetical protein